MKAELIIGLKKKSTFLVFVWVILISLLLVVRTPNLIEELIDEYTKSEYLGVEFMPFLNGILGLFFSFGGGIIVAAYGCADMISEKKSGVYAQRVLRLTEKKYVLSRLLFVMFEGIIVSILFTIFGVICQLYANSIVPEWSYELKFNSMVLLTWLDRIGCIIVMFIISYFIGMIIGYVIKNISLGIVISVMLEFFILGKTNILTAWATKSYQSSILMVTVPDKTILSGYSEPVLAAFELVVLAIVILISIILFKGYKTGYETGYET